MSAVVADDPALRVRRLGRVAYEPTWRRMQAFTDERGPETGDELWLLEHPPVFTQGLAGRPEHLLAPGDIPVVAVDRGGQVTYHGPGQLVAYPLLDVRRRRLGVRRLVSLLEDAVIRVLADDGITGHARRDAPGVYVAGAKIAQVGLRVRRGCSYHGLSFNVDMDLEPFSRINPCGYAGLEVIDLRSLGVTLPMAEAEDRLLAAIQAGLAAAE
ncbi:Octanoyltransferase [wastewater metagenome]|uniref:lipoyl(octanoyl) transferase n=2 Tax=unclassified sequences TaxID=12908 RepID=A0A5B8R557_9ZZZZ|nr:MULTISPECIES: lipoyl(octanoyl) transferase LipB [Arhodomonas]MCS4504100.1 lipoyl(octanoyl) transferase LipB [Arhodomonas aquaeolei]QEA03899.1 octanoyltransferase [uncultured organism]